jgi:hypothetical protein
MTCGWAILEGFLEINFLGLGVPSSGGLSPSVVVFKESIV